MTKPEFSLDQSRRYLKKESAWQLSFLASKRDFPLPWRFSFLNQTKNHFYWLISRKLCPWKQAFWHLGPDLTWPFFWVTGLSRCKRLVLFGDPRGDRERNVGLFIFTSFYALKAHSKSLYACQPLYASSARRTRDYSASKQQVRPWFAHIMWIRLPWPERLKTPAGSATWSNAEGIRFSLA